MSTNLIVSRFSLEKTTLCSSIVKFLIHLNAGLFRWAKLQHIRVEPFFLAALCTSSYWLTTVSYYWAASMANWKVQKAVMDRHKDATRKCWSITHH